MGWTTPPESADHDQTAASAGSTPHGGLLSGLRVLVAHPGAELYGSDRVVLESVVAIVNAGATAVEAALARTWPLIVSESSGLVEATHGLPGVHRVKPGDASAIADAVREIIAHRPVQREQAEAAAHLASLRFDPERYRASIVELIAGLVHTRA